MTIAEAKELDMVDYLSRMGFSTDKPPRDHNHWYLSPLHDEKTASFKVNRKMNRWYDFALGTGGNLIDFGILYHKCSVSDFLKTLDGPAQKIAQHKTIKDLSAEKEEEGKIKVLSVKPIISLPLIKYLRQRRIPVNIADQYLKEVNYELKDKKYYALGFKNDEGGYELRNQYVKAASSPKSSTFIDNGATNLAVFEGFFNFLSYRTIHQRLNTPDSNFLILNSTSFFEKNLPRMQAHSSVKLFLDNDSTGQKFTDIAKKMDCQKFSDERKLYQHYKDLNEWMANMGQIQKPQHRQRP